MNGMVITDSKAKSLISNGFRAMDPHVHSFFSYDVPNVLDNDPISVTNLQRSKGLIPVLTDHDTMDGYYYLKRKRLSDDVVPGVEIRITPKTAKLIDPKHAGKIHTLHINVYELNKRQFFNLEKIAKTGNLDEFTQFLKDNNLKWVYNHPFWHEHGERLNWKVIPELAKNYFDILEVNCNRSSILNNITLNIAKQLNKGVTACTDTHTGNSGSAYVVANGENFDEFWNNIKNRKSFIVRKDMTPMFVTAEISRMITQVFSADSRAMKAKHFRMTSGISFLDGIAENFSYGDWKDKVFFKSISKNALHSVNYSLGPIMSWLFYIKKQNSFGNNINSNILRITRSIKC